MIYEGIYTLQINQRIKMKTGWFRRDDLIFAGMPNEHTYSLVITWSSSHNSMAYNLFVPITQKEIVNDYATIYVRRGHQIRLNWS
ncbi:MAG: hypothetical protein ABIE07_12665 [Candidatus Zixiibacteriota bacterium]